MDHMRFAAEIQQAARRFQPQQAAADHRRPLADFGRLDDARAIVDGAETKHARLQLAVGPIQAFHRRKKRAASRRDQQYIIGGLNARRSLHHARRRIDLRDRRADMQCNVVFFIPRQRIDIDLAAVLNAAEHIGQQYPVIVTVRLVAEHRDVELFGAASGQHLLHRPRACHAVADDNQSLLCHARNSDVRFRSGQGRRPRCRSSRRARPGKARSGCPAAHLPQPRAARGRRLWRRPGTAAPACRPA